MCVYVLSYNLHTRPQIEYSSTLSRAGNFSPRNQNRLSSQVRLTFVTASSFYSHERPGGHRRVRRLGLVENFLESLQHRDAVGEHPVRQQKRVEKVDAEEPQVGQTLQQTFRRGGTDLRYLAGVQGTAEPYVHVVLEEFRVVSDRLRHRDRTSVRSVEQVVEVNVVHALADVADPSGLLLREILSRR